MAMQVNSVRTMNALANNPLRFILIIGISIMLFVSSSGFRNNRFQMAAKLHSTRQCSGKGLQLNMIFDFIRERSQEGIGQIQNIAKRSLEGQLGLALQESAEYIQN